MTDLTDEKYSHFFNAWGIKGAINVPIRKDEQTLLNPTQSCHQNVAYMQMKYGGQSVLGFTFTNGFNYYTNDDDVFVEPHSVWKTPEHNYLFHNMDYVDLSLGELEQDTILFAPVISFDATKEFYDLYERYVFHKDFFTRRIGNSAPEKHSFDFLKDKDFTSLIFHRDKPMTEGFIWEDYLEEREYIRTNP
tara:strand:- start:12 stop:584 length:573 start_codon:yes stop_codon:yes gene_type:complete